MRFILALVVCAALASQTNADAILKLTSGATTVSITDTTDGSGGDVNPLEGVITFVGAVGNFTLNVTTGTTKPFNATPLSPYMDLNNISATTSAGPGTLTIEFTDTDFVATSSSMGFVFQIGGTTQGWVASSLKADDGNAEFGGSTVASLGPYTAASGSFSGGTTGTIVGFTGSYSLTLVATVVHSASHSTSFNTDVTVPEPSSLAFLGSALGVIILRRRRRRS